MNNVREVKKPVQRIPPPRLYLYFDAIIRHGSIRSAAESLRIASSALNRRVLDLEQEVGTVLFDRLPSGVRLTAAGEIFAAHVRRTLNDVKQVGEQLQNMQGQFSGHVAIGSAESAAIDMMPGFIAEFQKQYVGARFTLAVGAPHELLSSLLEDRVDLILTHEEPAHADVAIIARVKLPFCALMRAGHPLSDSAKLMINDCQNFPIVLAQEQLAARALVDATMSARAPKMQPVLVTNMFEVMKNYVRRTDAVSFHFHLGATGMAQDGLVAVPLSDRQMSEARLMLAVRRGRTLPTGAATVCEWLREMLRERPFGGVAGA
jgi:DNA-binding transcriptional LysR family regulator